MAKAQAKTAADIGTKIAEGISKLGPDIEEGLIAGRVERELNKRVTALTQVYEKLERLNKDAKKLKPDQVSYDDEGNEVSRTWSENALKGKKELADKIGKFERVIETALTKGDFSEVYKLSDNPKPSTEGGN